MVKFEVYFHNYSTLKSLTMEEFVIEKINEIAFTEVDVNEPLWSSGILDSITIVELAVELENEYSINIPFEEITEENFQTVAFIRNYIEKKQPANDNA